MQLCDRDVSLELKHNYKTLEMWTHKLTLINLGLFCSPLSLEGSFFSAAHIT